MCLSSVGISLDASRASGLKAPSKRSSKVDRAREIVAPVEGPSVCTRLRPSIVTVSARQIKAFTQGDGVRIRVPPSFEDLSEKENLQSDVGTTSRLLIIPVVVVVAKDERGFRSITA
jgi:ribosomal protein L21E